MIIASDLEGTLTSGTTWKAVGRYLTQHGRQQVYHLFFVTHLLGVPFAKTHLIQEQVYRTRWMTDLARLLKGMTSAELVQMAAWVTEHELWPKRYTTLLQEIEAFHEQGHQVFLVTGTYQPVAEAFAQRISVTAIGTPLGMYDERATGRLASPVNNGQYKAESPRPYLEGAILDISSSASSSAD